MKTRLCSILALAIGVATTYAGDVDNFLAQYRTHSEQARAYSTLLSQELDAMDKLVEDYFGSVGPQTPTTVEDVVEAAGSPEWLIGPRSEVTTLPNYDTPTVMDPANLVDDDLGARLNQGEYSRVDKLRQLLNRLGHESKFEHLGEYGP